MLTSLLIRDFVLIERLELSPQQGLTVLTGETGAGKSILLDALGAACGARAEARFVRAGADKADITATFDLPRGHVVEALLRAQDMALEDGHTLILRRVIQADGRSKAFVNDTPVSIGLLKSLGDALLEVHGQFETTGLLDPKTHLEALDRFAQTDLAPLAAAHQTWRMAAAAENTLRHNLAAADEKEEALRTALDDLNKLSPKAGELDQLIAQQQTLRHKEKLGQALATALAALQSEEGAASTLETAGRTLSRILDLNSERLSQIITHLDAARDSVADAEGLLEHFISDLDDSGLTLEQIEDRLYALKSMARRHGVAPDALPELIETLEAELAQLSGGVGNLAQLEAATEKAKAAYQKKADQLTAERTKAARLLERRITAELAPLKMDKAKFAVDIAPAEPSALGQDAVRFLVSTNVGSPLGPMDRIASGGELARFMLALKAALAENAEPATVIFDEVDQGVGGAVATAVGERLRRLAQTGGQVLVVTHSPQVAAMGQTHWRISKTSSGKATSTHVADLSAEARREEIARMLAGAAITDISRKAADELLKGAEAAA